MPVREVVNRVAWLIVSLWVLMTVTFLMVRFAPGDPAVLIGGRNATEAQLLGIRSELGLDESIIVQYFQYLKDTVTLNLGNSYLTREPVESIIAREAPPTFALVGVALVGAILLSIVMGLFVAEQTAGRRNSRSFTLNSLFLVVTSLGLAIPEFVLAVPLVMVFALELGWFPVAGAVGVSAFVLPVVALSFRPLSQIGRVTHVEALATTTAPYFITAQTSQFRRRYIFRKHVLPNAAVGTITLAGVSLPAILGAEVIVETVFNWPGLGTHFISAILAQDYPVVQGILLTLGGAALVLNLLLDFLLIALNPEGNS